MILGNVFYLTLLEQEGWIRKSQEVPSNLNDAMILFYSVKFFNTWANKRDLICDILSCFLLFIISIHGFDFNINWMLISNLRDVAVPLLSNLSSTFYINYPILLCLSYFLLMFLIIKSSSKILFWYSVSFFSVLRITPIFWVFQKNLRWCQLSL